MKTSQLMIFGVMSLMLSSPHNLLSQKPSSFIGRSIASTEEVKSIDKFRAEVKLIDEELLLVKESVLESLKSQDRDQISKLHEKLNILFEKIKEQRQLIEQDCDKELISEEERQEILKSLESSEKVANDLCDQLQALDDLTVKVEKEVLEEEKKPEEKDGEKEKLEAELKEKEKQIDDLTCEFEEKMNVLNQQFLDLKKQTEQTNFMLQQMVQINQMNSFIAQYTRLNTVSPFQANLPCFPTAQSLGQQSSAPYVNYVDPNQQFSPYLQQQQTVPYQSQQSQFFMDPRYQPMMPFMGSFGDAPFFVDFNSPGSFIQNSGRNPAIEGGIQPGYQSQLGLNTPFF